jgi:hypothetical protein
MRGRRYSEVSSRGETRRWPKRASELSSDADRICVVSGQETEGEYFGVGYMLNIAM